MCFGVDVCFDLFVCLFGLVMFFGLVGWLTGVFGRVFYLAVCSAC